MQKLTRRTKTSVLFGVLIGLMGLAWPYFIITLIGDSFGHTTLVLFLGSVYIVTVLGASIYAAVKRFISPVFPIVAVFVGFNALSFLFVLFLLGG